MCQKDMGPLESMVKQPISKTLKYVINGSEKEYLNNQKNIPEVELPPTSIMNVKQMIEASKLCIALIQG